MTETPLPPALQRIAVEVEHERAHVLAEVTGLSQAQADWKPAPGEWSIGEALDHLARAEALSGRMISASLKRAAETGPLPPYPGVIAEFPWSPPTAGDRWMVQAPEPAAPVAGKPIEALRRALAEQSEWTAKVLARLATVDPRACAVRHPIIGDMDLAQWCRFAAYHLRIHLRQIQDVRAAAGFPRA